MDANPSIQGDLTSSGGFGLHHLTILLPKLLKVLILTIVMHRSTPSRHLGIDTCGDQQRPGSRRLCNWTGFLHATEAELARREGREYEPASVLLERIKKEREKAENATAKRKSGLRRQTVARG